MKESKASKYTDFAAIYGQCSGPGGLELAEFVADKMQLRRESTLIDIGYNRGYQTCFLAKEYGVRIVAIDPLDDMETGRPNSEYLMKNAETFDVSERILPVKTGVPDSRMAEDYFDGAYSTTTLEMLRGYAGQDVYDAALREVYRILKPGGCFGLGEPMHLDAPIPPDLAEALRENQWEDCFASLSETVDALRRAGFAVLEAGHCKEADRWWREFVAHDPQCVEEDRFVIENNRGRWLSYGYVIAQKPLV